MNAGRSFIDGDLLVDHLKNNSVTMYWFLGFIEVEGTFGIKNNIPNLQIDQHVKNKLVMNKINMSISTFPMSNFTSILSKVINNINKPYFNIVLNKKTNVLSYTIFNIDILYHFIVPFLNNLKFQSRKIY